MRSVVVGLGETGFPLFEILKERYGESIYGYDLDPERQGLVGEWHSTNGDVDILNICIGWSQQFVDIVRMYQDSWHPKTTVIHSTVPIGTTRNIGNAVHSPILGKHGRMKDDLRTYPKWIGGEGANDAVPYFEAAKIRTNVVKTPEETELFKLLCLAKYGMSIAFSVYQKKLCDKFGIDYADVHLWDTFYNEGVLPSLKRPLITPPMNEKIGGHCVVPGTRILNGQFPNQILEEILKHE